MHKLVYGALAVLATTSVPAHASLKKITYSGAITEIIDPDASFGFHVGDTIHYSVTFDDAKLVNVSNTFFNIDAITGLPVSIPGLQTASLADDLRASATVTIGSYTFSKFDALGYGQNYLGVGNFPVVVFDGATFLGAVLDVATSNGFELDTDPIAKILHYFPDDTLSFDDNTGGVGFIASTDVGHAIVSSVPEPATWSILLVGFVGAGLSMRRRNRSAIFAHAH